MAKSPDSRAFWDEAARNDPYWYIATRSGSDARRFYALGAAETDGLLAICGIVPDEGHTVLELGCGAGRMTRRLSELFGQVIALDVSGEMLKRAQDALADRHNVGYILGSGFDLSDLADQSVDIVFSYITLQHVPAASHVLSYIRETARVLRPGGQAALQVRTNTAIASALDLAGHVAHAMSGRPTFRREWRGVRVADSRMLAAARSRGAHVRLQQNGLRHTWLLMSAPRP
jgi:SAM-dependent methyltransferase